MKIVGGDVDVHSDDFKSNYDLMMAKNAELDEIVAKTIDVGQRQREIAAKRGKLLPRERINAVLDRGSPFLEVGQLSGYDYIKGIEASVPSGNVVAGIG